MRIFFGLLVFFSLGLAQCQNFKGFLKEVNIPIIKAHPYPGKVLVVKDGKFYKIGVPSTAPLDLIPTLPPLRSITLSWISSKAV